MAVGFVAAVDEIVLDTPSTTPPDTSNCPPLELYTTAAPITTRPPITAATHNHQTHKSHNYSCSDCYSYVLVLLSDFHTGCTHF